ncbi:hypothetical protein HZS_775 [Henneguya salminicola]|nr:hypothetical protein HZS_775 [Henneguya salminicola]
MCSKVTKDNCKVRRVVFDLQAAITEAQRWYTFLRWPPLLEIHDEYYQLMLWVTNESLTLQDIIPTRSLITLSIYICTFTRCLIVMVYRNGTDLYVPCIYIQQFFMKL